MGISYRNGKLCSPREEKPPLKAAKSGKPETGTLVPSIPNHYSGYESTFTSEKFCGKSDVSMKYLSLNKMTDKETSNYTSLRRFEELMRVYNRKKEESFMAQRDYIYCFSDLSSTRGHVLSEVTKLAA